jgi:hypothetical protein
MSLVAPTLLEMCLPVPYAYDLEYVWQVTGVAKGSLYWVRCRAYLDVYFGPWCPSLPPNIIPDVYVRACRDFVSRPQAFTGVVASVADHPSLLSIDSPRICRRKVAP